eukprot:Gb_33236 [translate_table: standard]
MMMSSNRMMIVVFLVFSVVSAIDGAKQTKKRKLGPSSLVFYYHDIVFDGTNNESSTATVVASANTKNLTHFTLINNRFGDIIVFNDLLTLGPHLNSTSIGRAQGLYFYDQKDKFSAWFAFTAVLDHSPHYKGALTFMGADIIELNKRDISVVGGTGDFALARGIATLQTDFAPTDDITYFRLLITVDLVY